MGWTEIPFVIILLLSSIRICPQQTDIGDRGLVMVHVQAPVEVEQKDVLDSVIPLVMTDLRVQVEVNANMSSLILSR